MEQPKYDQEPAVDLESEGKKVADAYQQERPSTNEQVDSKGPALPPFMQGKQISSFTAFMTKDMTNVKSEEVLDEGIDHIASFLNEIVAVEGQADLKTALPGIRLGKVCNKIKPIVKKEKKKWTEWLEEYFNQLKPRAIQGYMKIAEIENVEQWAFLGKKRLMDIAPGVLGKKGDPIGVLFAAEKLDREQASKLEKDQLAEIWEKILEKVKLQKRWEKIKQKVEGLDEFLQEEFQEHSMFLAADPEPFNALGKTLDRLRTKSE